MLTLCKQNKNIMLNKIKNKLLDNILMCNVNLIDEILLSMSKEGFIDHLGNSIEDKRQYNSIVPLSLIILFSVASKMKNKPSMTDIPFAIKNSSTLAKLGYSGLKSKHRETIFNEGTIRFLLKKYNHDDLIKYYNSYVQNKILNAINQKPIIHLLDCTKIAVNYENTNYENSTIALDRKGESMRGYKLATLRGLTEETGIIEDIRLGTVSTHDLKLSEEMIRTSPCFKSGDVLINDRGFISRELINYMKVVRGVNTYVPLKRNMEAYTTAIEAAKIKNEWTPHPNRKRKTSVITFIDNLKEYWVTRAEDEYEDVDFNACVVWDKATDEYFAFITTDLTKSAEEIVRMYELRPEIEEDYRQLKDFWKLEDFKSTKYDVITYHIICVLFGYLFYQLYLSTDSGRKYIGKSLPCLLKNEYRNEINEVLLQSGEYFCILDIHDFFELLLEQENEVREFILGKFKKANIA
ncbi:MAG: transposase [Anaerorhabdus sp.]|uniref:transposase n=1 Tax=Anaerorhabdus sp. TaxID=1872524 RepID=UPI002FC89169